MVGLRYPIGSAGPVSNRAQRLDVTSLTLPFGIESKSTGR
jgi:hypothetical protein